MTTTATRNVIILDENFSLPNLGRRRRIWIYLPEGYTHTHERYPVIYMHDGQNLFDENNAFGNEWKIDETLDADHGKVIIVGIDNGETHRMAEYMLYDHPEHGAAEGSLYLKDIAEAVKPHIDAMFRTMPQREHTTIAGSSMGGLISFYAGLYFPHVFGNVGIFSPALWIDAPRIFKEALEIGQRTNLPQRWYFYAGAQESESMVAELAAMVHIFRDVALFDVTYQIDSDGIHDEQLWQRYFPFFYKWLVGHVPGEVIVEVSDIKI
jgi:predicted alpha/beta superfamily hydrolase